MRVMEVDRRSIFLGVIKPFMSDIASNIDIIEQRLATEGYYGNFVRDLQIELDKLKEVSKEAAEILEDIVDVADVRGRASESRVGTIYISQEQDEHIRDIANTLRHLART